MVISVRLKPPKSCLQPRILSDDLSDFNRNWNSKPELAGVMVCCLAGGAKTERPRRAKALLGAYWCKTFHNYLPLWPPLLENTNRNAVRKPSQQGHRFLGLLFISFTHSPHQLENVTAVLSKTGPVFFPMNYSAEEPGACPGQRLSKESRLWKPKGLCFASVRSKSSLNNNSHLWRLIKLASSLHWRRGAGDFFFQDVLNFCSWSGSPHWDGGRAM